MTEIVYIMDYQPSSASARIGRGNGATKMPRLSDTSPLTLILALLGIAYILSKK